VIQRDGKMEDRARVRAAWNVEVIGLGILRISIMLGMNRLGLLFGAVQAHLVVCWS
jgi:hypothetical protein